MYACKHAFVMCMYVYMHVCMYVYMHACITYHIWEGNREHVDYQCLSHTPQSPGSATGICILRYPGVPSPSQCCWELPAKIDCFLQHIESIDAG